MLSKKRKSTVAGQIVKKYLARKKDDAEFVRLAEMLIPSIKKDYMFKDGYFISYVRPSSVGKIKVGKLIRAMRGNRTETPVQCQDIVRKAKVQHERRGHVKITRFLPNKTNMKEDEFLYI